MPSMIQLRNVPPGLHKRIKARAAMLGKSMSDYLLEEIEEAMSKPTLQELIEAVASAPPVSTSPSVVALVRQERDRE